MTDDSPLRRLAAAAADLLVRHAKDAPARATTPIDILCRAVDALCRTARRHGGDEAADLDFLRQSVARVRGGPIPEPVAAAVRRLVQIVVEGEPPTPAERLEARQLAALLGPGPNP